MQTNCNNCDTIIACNNDTKNTTQIQNKQKFNIQDVLNDIDLNK